jgi:hypothetical protein
VAGRLHLGPVRVFLGVPCKNHKNHGTDKMARW